MIFVGLTVAGVLAAVFAFLTLFQKDLYAGALCLLGVLVQVAVIYFLLGAQILALIQALVYAGAVMVLVVTAVMASPRHLKERWVHMNVSNWLAAVVLVAPAVEVGTLFAKSYISHNTVLWGTPPLEHEMARILFGPYALMTETAGVIILVSALALILAER